MLANRLSADPSTGVLVLEAGRPDYEWDVFIHMPAALTFPIGSRFYDWKYETEPEPFMNGRRIYHARGKVLGGSSSINGMIFQRGNPLDYERWAADPGMETWDYAHCLPYFKRMENCLGRRRRVPRRRRPLVLERGPATNPLFERFFEAVQQAGYPLTDDVNGYQQEGFAKFDRNIRRGRRLSAARAYLHPVMQPPEPRRSAPGAGHRASCSTARARSASSTAAAAGRTQPCDAGEVICAAARSTRRSCCSSRASATRSELDALGIDVVHDLPASASTCRTTSRCTSSTPARNRCRCSRALKMWRGPWIGLQWLFLRRGPGATNHFEARRLRAQQRRRGLSQHDVPLPADRDPLRRLDAGQASTATRCTSGRCTPTRAAR